MEKKQNKFVLAVIVIAVSLNLVTVMMPPFQEFSVGNLLMAIVVAIEHMAVLYYILIGYRKPHGNLLRYVMLLFALTIGMSLVVFGKEYPMLNFALPVAEILLIPYIAGRLNKVEQNKILMPLVLILFIVDSISYCISTNEQTFFDCFLIFGQAIEWFAISAAYFVRYKEHREAGLADAPKK